MTPDKVVEVLNRLLAADPEAMTALLKGVPCNETFAHDPDVIVLSFNGIEGPFKTSALGLINGLLGFEVMAVYCTDVKPWKLLRFESGGSVSESRP